MPQVGAFIAAAGTVGRRRAVGAAVAAAGLGQFIAGPSSRSRARAFRSSALVPTAVRVIIAIGFRSRSQSRRFAGYSPRHFPASAWPEDRSFEPSNDALQPASGAGASGSIGAMFKRRSRLSASVIRTEKKDIGSVGIGVVWNDAVFIVAPRFFDCSRGFHRPDAFGRSDLRRGNERRNTSASGCCERRGCLGRSPRSSGRLATLGQRRAGGAPIAASSTTRGPGSIHRWPAFRSKYEATPPSGSSRPSGRLSSPSGPAV